MKFNDIFELLQLTGKPFWLAGGYAIDSFLGKSSREHDDLDIVIKREDQLFFQKALDQWELLVANPPGSEQLETWREDDFLELPLHNIWGRRSSESPWELELLISEFEGEEWVYRRNAQIRGSIQDFGWKDHRGLMIIQPDIQLLYKSRSQRDKDIFDLKNCLEIMTNDQRRHLMDWIITDSSHDHPWIDFIKTTL